MAQKYRMAMLTALFLLGTSLSGVVQAQTVDPCSYGCPKAGCPNCPEGGPLNKSTADAAKATSEPQGTAGGAAIPVAYDPDKCISSCDMQYDACIKKGNSIKYCDDQNNDCVKKCHKYK